MHLHTHHSLGSIGLSLQARFLFVFFDETKILYLPEIDYCVSSNKCPGGYLKVKNLGGRVYF